MATAEPIFVHSLFRSASTYFFQKFRSIDSFCCYQEPFNESLAALNFPWRHYRLLESPTATTELRHPLLDRPYFYEFWASRQHLRGLYHRAFAYDQYFVKDAQLPAQQQAWISALLEHAAARPMLQLSRSSGRVAALRRLYGGRHVQLWREPRVQWWSYKAADYFDSVTRRIYRSTNLPETLLTVYRMAGTGRLRARHLRPRGNYLLFYGLWLDAWLRLRANCELSINVDRIALDPAENAGCSRQLSELAGHPISLSDVRASGMVLTADEEPFYTEAESAVNDLFVRSGHATPRSVQDAVEAAESARRAHDGREHDATAEQNLRLAALSLMECLAGGGRAGGRRWPRRWYPRRLHDFVHWMLIRRRHRRAPAQRGSSYGATDSTTCTAGVPPPSARPS